MFNLGPMELLVIVVVALVVLGPQRLPGAMGQVGKAVAEARRWSTSLTASVQTAFEDEPARPAPPLPAPAATEPAPAAAGEGVGAGEPAGAGVPA